MAEDQPKKGVKMRIFGVILIFVGVLDGMLAWRGGFQLSGFYVVLFASGVLLFALGAVRGRRRPEESR